jgi:hypothetical protein
VAAHALDRLALLPAAVQVTYRAPLAKFRQITPADFALGLPPARPANAGENRLAVIPLKVPEKTVVTAIEPRWVEYFILD